jgi:hypothetical protein
MFGNDTCMLRDIGMNREAIASQLEIGVAVVYRTLKKAA